MATRSAHWWVERVKLSLRYLFDALDELSRARWLAESCSTVRFYSTRLSLWSGIWGTPGSDQRFVLDIVVMRVHSGFCKPYLVQVSERRIINKETVVCALLDDCVPTSSLESRLKVDMEGANLKHNAWEKNALKSR